LRHEIRTTKKHSFDLLTSSLLLILLVIDIRSKANAWKYRE